jgi:hypothetical protein
MRIQFFTITANLKDFVRRTDNIILHTSRNEEREMYTQKLTIYYLVIFASVRKEVDCKHAMCRISSEI